MTHSLKPNGVHRYKDIRTIVSRIADRIMQIAISSDDFCVDKVFFCNRTENTVISGGGFYRVMYCDDDITMLGVHILFSVDMTVEDGPSSRLDVREALAKITPKVMEAISDFTASVHRKWTAIYGEKSNSYPVTAHTVEPAILKALIHARNSISSNASDAPKPRENVIKMPFVFKCAGVFDTEQDAGVSFRLNSVIRL